MSSLKAGDNSIATFGPRSIKLRCQNLRYSRLISAVRKAPAAVAEAEKRTTRRDHTGGKKGFNSSFNKITFLTFASLGNERVIFVS